MPKSELYLHYRIKLINTLNYVFDINRNDFDRCWTSKLIISSNLSGSPIFSKLKMVKVLTWEDVGLPEASNVLNAATISKQGLVYTSGSVGIRDGKLPESVEEQTVNVIENLKTVLQAAGSSLDSVVKVLVFITDPADFGKMNGVYGKYFITKPARSCVVTQLANPQLKVEIELVAEVE
ncbi:hypothetical protein CAS74_004712 [Pichia kudriavzevii]|uniref:Uncharacterized protein n=2 Tax=Pichia kudriavzevii TaxID=4909 RepID=A0A1Z8JIQ3_PICKU|nr:uncharacterized protein C5L36_0B10510 [Pichia kudriavzevii]AWU75815.1 hypothetical protein C5L36_0B10510 [Pichia kudriavzevii]OUT20460.1 hypothetical protein CAS74_004712 [Pichia kudriavzevii]